MAASPQELAKLRETTIEIPCIVDGKEVFTGNVEQQLIVGFMPILKSR
jgi:hypothetical protein